MHNTLYVLTLKGRPPLRLTGLETYERLVHVACPSLDLLAQRDEPRLARLSQGLQAALSSFAETYQRAATFGGASPALPLAESLLETDPSTIQSTASAVVSTPGYRHRVTFAVLRPKDLRIAPPCITIFIQKPSKLKRGAMVQIPRSEKASIDWHELLRRPLCIPERQERR
jgi:hypothetical protein